MDCTLLGCVPSQSMLSSSLPQVAERLAWAALCRDQLASPQGFLKSRVLSPAIFKPQCAKKTQGSSRIALLEGILLQSGRETWAKRAELQWRLLDFSVKCPPTIASYFSEAGSEFAHAFVGTRRCGGPALMCRASMRLMASWSPLLCQIGDVKFTL